MEKSDIDVYIKAKAQVEKSKKGIIVITIALLVACIFSGGREFIVENIVIISVFYLWSFSNLYSRYPLSVPVLLGIIEKQVNSDPDAIRYISQHSENT